jgi:galactokinase
MVCDAALVANIVASVMMNGVCCVHNMHEQEATKDEHRESLRKMIKVEWERQRILEQDMMEQKLRGDDAAMQAEERRRLLMAAKMRASRENSSSDLGVDNLVRPNTSHRGNYDSRSAGALGGSAHGLTSPSEIQHRVRSMPVYSQAQASQLRQSYRESIPRTTSLVSSLLDEEEDSDDEDGDREFDEVVLL